jgi:hypothetical protein
MGMKGQVRRKGLGKMRSKIGIEIGRGIDSGLRIGDTSRIDVIEMGVIVAEGLDPLVVEGCMHVFEHSPRINYPETGCHASTRHRLAVCLYTYTYGKHDYNTTTAMLQRRVQSQAEIRATARIT